MAKFISMGELKTSTAHQSFFFLQMDGGGKYGSLGSFKFSPFDITSEKAKILDTAASRIFGNKKEKEFYWTKEDGYLFVPVKFEKEIIEEHGFYYFLSEKQKNLVEEYLLGIVFDIEKNQYAILTKKEWFKGSEEEILEGLAEIAKNLEEFHL